MQDTPGKLQVVLVVLFAVVCVSVGEALLSAGMKQVGRGGSGGLKFLLHAAANGHVLSGVALMMVFFGLYALALSWADLSFVLPLTALSFLFGALLAHFFLGEAVSTTRWIGTLVIMVGVVVVGLGERRVNTTHPRDNAAMVSSEPRP